MVGRTSMASLILISLAAAASIMTPTASALIHVVGGSNGWEIPPNATFYAEWAKPRTFGVGDKLVFPYRTGAHNVLQVSAKDFETCSDDDVINYFFKGPTVVQLNATGDYYYYSGVGTHCEAGQKLHITVGKAPGSSGKFYYSAAISASPLAPAPAPPVSSATAAQLSGVFASVFAVSHWLFV
ncbi:hypothetical protein Nepgr_030691 [Nepenthes gracilis]|uniref:Phytocyanin domain-containing protein n=1 Tax=Nepenthes gracilis TaxID=150966 RepID=A0AAD3TF92_NEPGR|nr:hypothetical protein Nepgr_030691 [Nepenthes gracilis]